jgi:Ca-activated chloride channel family protein
MAGILTRLDRFILATMRFLLTSAIVLVTASALLGQQATFRAGTSIVPVLATVLDKEGRLVPDLEQSDFTILDNGKPQEVVFFQNDVQPFSVVVMMDFSFSMNANLKLLKAAAEQFILRLLPADRAQVGAFSDKIMFSGSFTSDRDDLVAALEDLQFGNPTRLYDAIDASIDLLDDTDVRRKVVLVFTDGDDTASRKGFGAVLEKAREKEVMVYAIGLQSEFFNGQRMQRSRPDRSLRRLADETGGGYFELTKTAELAPTFTRVAQELHSLYALGFTPATLDGKEHRLDVRVTKAGMNVRSRKTYIASQDRLSERSEQ